MRINLTICEILAILTTTQEECRKNFGGSWPKRDEYYRDACKVLRLAISTKEESAG
jgi:hypothetical protein